MTETASPRRSLPGYFAWAATALAVAVTLARAVRTGRGWGMVAAAVVMFVLYGFLPRIEAATERRRKRAEGMVRVDEWGVTRVAGDLREAIAWADIAWVRIYTTSAGPGADDVFFALGGADGKGCLVSMSLATPAHLLEALQRRLPGLDNMAVAIAMGSTNEAVYTIWTRPDDPAKTTAGKGAPS